MEPYEDHMFFIDTPSWIPCHPLFARNNRIAELESMGRSTELRKDMSHQSDS